MPDIFFKCTVILITIILNLMISEVIDCLIQAGIYGQEDKEDLQQELQNCQNPSQMIQYLLDLSGYDSQKQIIEQRQIIYCLSSNEKLNEYLRPNLQFEIIKMKFIQHFEGQSELVNKKQISKNLTKYVKDYYMQKQKLFKKMFYQLIYIQIQNGDLLDVLNFFRNQQHHFQAIQKTLSSNQQIQIQQDKTKILYKEYLTDLQKQIEGQPQNIVDIKLRNIEIYTIRKFLLTGQEILDPQNLQYINSLSINNREALNARQAIRQGRLVIINLRVFRRYACGININLLLRLLNDGRAKSAENLKLLQNNPKHRVILFFGNTKAGKTTLITRLLNIKLIKKVIKGIHTLQPQINNFEEFQKRYPDLNIGYSNKSTTRYPRLFQVPQNILPEDEEQELQNYSGQPIYLMDSPGLLETAGVEYQIANRILTNQFLQHVSNLSIVLLISAKDWGSHGKDIIELVKMLSLFIKDYKQVSKSILIGVNQADKKFIDSFKANIIDLQQNIMSNAESSKNSNFINIFEHLKKTKIIPIEPDKLNPKQFLFRCVKKIPIQEPFFIFKNEIGYGPSTQIKNLVKRCQTQMQKFYENGQLEQFYYYFNLLNKISTEKKLQGEADKIQQKFIEKQETKLSQKIQKFSKQVQQMQFSAQYENDQRRKEKYLILKKTLQQLYQQIERIRKLSNNQNFLVQLNSSLSESQQYYLQLVEQWKSDAKQYTSLYLKTQNALQFYQNFSNAEGKKRIKSRLKSIQSNTHNQLVKILEQQTTQNTDKKLLKIESLTKLLKQQLGLTDYQNIIAKNYDKKKQKLKFFQSDNIDYFDYELLLNFLKSTKSNEKIENFIAYCQIVQKYPQKITSKIRNEAVKYQKLFTDQLPRQMVKKFTQSIRSFEEEDEEGLTQIKKNDKIIQIKKLMECMNFFKQVSQVSQIHGESLTDKFEQLIYIIETSLRKFQNLKDDFKNNTILTAIQKMRKQMKKLQHLVKISNKQSLNNRFQQLKRDLGHSYQQFIQRNKIRTKLSIRDHGQIRRLCECYSKLDQIKPYQKILGQVCQIQNVIDKQLDLIKSQLLDPSESLLKALNGNKILTIKIIQEYLNFESHLRKQGQYILTDEIFQRIMQLDKQIIIKINQYYEEKIVQPLDNLTKIIQESQDNKENWIDNLFKQFTGNSIKQDCRKAYIFIKQVKQIQLNFHQKSDPNLVQQNIQCAFQVFNSTIINQMDSINISSKVLIKLRKIVTILKQIDPETFSDIYKNIANRLNIAIHREQMNMTQMIKSIKQSKQLKPEDFIYVYSKLKNNQSENGQEVQQILKYLQHYKDEICRKIEKMKIDIIDDEIEGFPIKLYEMLKQLNTYLSATKKIQEEFKDDKDVSSRMKIQSLQDIVKSIVEKAYDYYNGLKSEINFKKKNQIVKLLNKLGQFDRQIINLKDFGVDIQKIETQLKLQITGGFKQGINQLHRAKKQIKDEIVSKKGDLLQITKINKYFERIYDTLEQEDRYTIKDVIIQSSKRTFGNITSLYQQDYPEYNQIINQLNDKIDMLPRDIRQSLQKDLKNKKQEVNAIAKQKLQKIKRNCQTIDFKIMIQIIKQLLSSKNIKELKEIMSEIQRILLNFIHVSNGSQLVSFLIEKFHHNIQVIKQIIKNIRQMKSLSCSHNQIFDKVEEKICQKLSKFGIEKAKKFLKLYYQNQPSSDDYSDTSQNNCKKNYYLQTLEELSRFYQQQPGQFLSPTSSKHAQQLKNKVNQIFDELLQKASQVIDKAQKFNRNQLGKEQIEQFLKSIHFVAEHSSLISSKMFKKMQKYPTLLKKNKQIKKIQTQVSNKIKGIKEIVQKFEFYSEKVKNNSPIDDQQRITIFQKNMQILTQYLSPFNNYIPQLQEQIISEQILKHLKQKIQNIIPSYIKALEQSLQNEEEQVVNCKVLYIPKFLKIINQKPRKYFLNCVQIEGQIVKKMKDIFTIQKNKFEECRIQFQSKAKKISQNRQEFRQKQKKNLQNKKRQLKTNTDDKKKQITQKFQQEIQNLSKQYQNQEKQKKKKQLECKIEQIQNMQKRKQLELQQNYHQRIKRYEKQNNLSNQQSLRQLIQVMKKIKKIQQLPQLRDNSIKALDRGLIICKESLYVLKAIYKALQDNDSLLSQKIIEQHNVFQKLKNIKFQQITSATNSPQFILDKMQKNREINRQQYTCLLKYFKTFEMQQSKYFQQYQVIKNTQIVQKIKNEIQVQGQSLRNCINKQKPFINQIRVKLLAKIFALWSLQDAERQRDQQSEKGVIYLKAHAAQIICILLLLCIDQPNQDKAINLNRLTEVKTGEGKSIVLAGLSIYFALLGYKVHCACYSQILSHRDELQFKHLFQLCGVSKLIQYGIFQTMIKKILNQKRKSNDEEQKFQDIIQRSLMNNGDKTWAQRIQQFISNFVNFFQKSQKTKTILIIDETDILFDSKYFGETFNLSIQLRHPTITNLFKYIWRQKDKLKFNDIKNSQQFKKVIQNFQLLKDILENQIYGMLAAFRTYNEQTYHVIDKRIKYRINDTFKQVSYSYNTVYAYLHQYDNRKVSQASMNEHLSISLCIAQFAYASLPKYYSHIVGVTGTLKCLPQFTKKQLKSRYDIDTSQLYAIPSVYGSNTENRRILQPKCVPQKNHLTEVIKMIEQFKMNGQPILIFFRDKTDILNLYHNQAYSPYRYCTSYITEQDDQQERNQRIKNSSMDGAITLMTKSYIRGTDFKLINKKATNKGGFLAIVTFLIDSITDYIQATGRVARQGKPGVFIEIYSQQELVLLDIEQNKKMHLKQFTQKRELIQQKLAQSIQPQLNIADKKHEQTIKVFQNFKKSKLIKYIYNKNRFPEIIDTKSGRIALVIDATISMGKLFTDLKSILPQIFEDVYETLKSKKFKSHLQMQIILYRNYNSDIYQLLQYSPLESNSEPLKKFIAGSSTKGGWQNEAVQVGLQQASRIKDLDEIILIGDAKGNQDWQIVAKRQLFKNLEKKRQQTGYFPYTTTKQQLEKFVQRKVCINGFYLNNSKYVQDYFKSLSNATGGISTYLNISSNNAANHLNKFIVERALNAIGGIHQGASLINEYKKILSKRLDK